MATFRCDEISLFQPLDAYLAREDELILRNDPGCFSSDTLYRCTGNHLLVFSIRTPDKSGDKYRFKFLEYHSEFKYVSDFVYYSNKIQTIEAKKNLIVYISSISPHDVVRYGDNSVSGLMARMTLANRYDVRAVADRFSYRNSNYTFGWDYPEWDVPVLGEYRHKNEYIGVVLHIDKNGNFHIKPSEHNVVLKHNNNDKVLYFDCSLRSIYSWEALNPSKNYPAEVSPYSIDRYKILYDALVSVFNIELIDKER